MLNYNDIVNWRRMFHQYPELSNDEFETTKRIRRILQQYDIRHPHLRYTNGYRFVAEIGQGLPCIAVRTDIDALPIDEQVNHAFTSTNEGVMHACGHDIHMASILAVAVQLKALETSLVPYGYYSNLLKNWVMVLKF